MIDFFNNLKDVWNQVVDFVNVNYKFLLFCWIFIVSFVSLIKGKSSAKAFIQVFNAVLEAEKTFPEPNSGSVKLAYVINSCSNLKEKYVVNTVEQILSSPQKK